MSFAIGNGYPVFTDTRGLPLNEGYVYIGVKGFNPLSNPQEVFWDAALTIPATDIRTSGGYALYSGSPGQLFTEEPYSILVADKNGSTVLYQPNGAEEEDGQDVIFSEAGEEYLLSSSAAVGDRVSIVVKPEAPDAKITQPDGVTIIRGLSDRTVTGAEGRFVTRPNQSLKLTKIGVANVYDGNFTFILSDYPDTPPTALAPFASWSPDGRYLIVTQSASPTVLIYDWASGSAVKLADITVPPSGLPYGVAWSPDGTRVSFTSSASPYIITYDWNAGTPIKLANPATLPAGISGSCTWSPDGRYLAVAHSGSPYITIYDWSTGVPIKLTNPATLPTGEAYGVTWSPDGRYLAVAHTVSPFVTIYDWSSGAPVKITNPSTLPTGIGRKAAWSPDGRYLAVSHDTSPYITFYDWSSGAPAKIANPSTLPTGNADGVTWSPDGRYLAVRHATAPYIRVYDFEYPAPISVGDFGTGVSIGGTGSGASWSPNGKFLTITSNLGPYYLLLFTSTEELSNAWALQHIDGPAIFSADFDNRTP